jgi:cysteine desulfurase
MIYFDNSATTRLSPDVLDAMMPFFTEFYGNPSSTYKLGQKSRFAIDKARRTISEYINSSPQEIVFTAGGTESINLAIKGTAEAMKVAGKDKVHIFTSIIDHSAVLSSLKHLGILGYEVHYIEVSPDGSIKINELEKTLKEIDSKNIIASFQYANSEIGTIQDIKTISDLVKEYNGIVHIDAMQTFKFYKIDVNDLNIDMMTFAPHKFNGPKGIGAL